MFKIDRFSPDGLILVNDNEEGRSDESMADHNIDDFHMPTFVGQFAVPSEILLPLKNNTEKELLLRFADLAAQIDHHIDIFTSSYQNWFTQSVRFCEFEFELKIDEQRLTTKFLIDKITESRFSSQTS